MSANIPNADIPQVLAYNVEVQIYNIELISDVISDILQVSIP